MTNSCYASHVTCYHLVSTVSRCSVWVWLAERWERNLSSFCKILHHQRTRNKCESISCIPPRKSRPVDKDAPELLRTIRAAKWWADTGVDYFMADYGVCGTSGRRLYRHDFKWRGNCCLLVRRNARMLCTTHEGTNGNAAASYVESGQLFHSCI